MDKIVEAILKLQPFGKFFKWLGCNDDWSALFSVIVTVLLVTVVVKIFNTLLKHHKHCKAALEDIKPQFDHLSIQKAKKYYIQTQYQNASPARQEEPGFTHKYIARNKLIPFFTKIAFNEKADSERFYLILADSGMGKTTFMINLYLEYNSFFSYPREYEMKLFRFSNPDTINEVKAIKPEDAKRTILLLDALDEDRGIISMDPQISDAIAFQNRIDEIIALTLNFREVLITCRTQYFPGQEEDPYELKIKRPDEKGFYQLNKLYISPFKDKEVAKYLNKKFGIIPFINREKKKRAREIVARSKNLVMRPMLLSYIDYLTEDEVSEVSTYSIYDKLVTKWLLREAEKRKGTEDRKGFMKNLRNLSHRTAIAIYYNWRKEGRMFITKEEALKIAAQFNIQLKPDEITGQSLLTCDGAGNWKFAHKSILEFFLANEASQRPKFLKDMSFKGMDMARKFYGELNPGMLVIDQLSSPKYIYSCVLRSEFDEVMGLSDGSKERWRLGNKFSLGEALYYCNKMNRKNGYSSVYNDESRFQGIENIRGFRLPTERELLYLVQAKLIGVGDLFNRKQYAYEWCHNDTGYGIIHFSFGTNKKQIVDEPSYFRLVFVP
ncbi:hypothetical protein A3860_36455 [Niastella vici]|uniref:NACHT domain-containing protein n=1 Tax=Niastella vici TaxID=1703345 RepID=A0A1V9FMT0_9BACT|nr:hypothetical protein [Niastella vici]OQP59664.1 hypothetical protein A3860_36455 [Niastella vici]